MSNTARLALAAAAVVVVAFLGFRYLLPANVGDPGETPVPTTVSSPQALPAVGALEPGTYVINEEPNTTAHPYTLTVPAGWNTDDGFVTKGDSGAADEPDVFVTSWIVTHVFADACLWTTAQADSLVEARTPAEIVDALANQAGHETAGPTAVTVDGYPAQRLEFNVPDTFDIAACNESFLRLWPDPGPNFSGGLPTDVGQRTVIYVVDIDGDAAVIIGASMSDATSTDVAEMQAVLASIQFSEASP